MSIVTCLVYVKHFWSACCKTVIRCFGLLLVPTLFGACIHTPITPPVTGHPKVVLPTEIQRNISWTQGQKNLDIAIQHAYRDESVSTHYVRLQGQEPPHYHDRHSLSITVLSGESTIHFADHEVSLFPGDVVLVPKGTFHWAQNNSEEGSVVFVTFTPPFDGKDRRIVSRPDE